MGEVETAEAASRGRFWFAFGTDEDEAASSSWRLCLAFASCNIQGDRIS